jgi:1-acyl-sn-glycerol-3-phosphate acyltransferase
MTWYRFWQVLLWVFSRLVARVRVEGKDNLPKNGPFVVVANHQSYLDPILVQVSCWRPLHTLAKSTQFAQGGFMGWVMPRINAIPTRRYCIDPQAVRVLLRRLEEGEGVGVYPEGERSWDASLQPFRRGTIRVLLKAGAPIVPCGIVGSYDVWPRWSRVIRRRPVRIVFGEPIRWHAMDRRHEREAFVPEATRVLNDALSELSSWDRLAEEERMLEEVGGRWPPWLLEEDGVGA